MKSFHIGCVVPLSQPTVKILPVKSCQSLSVKLDPKPRGSRHDDSTAGPFQSTIDNDIFIATLPWPVGIASIVEITGGRCQMSHGREGDAQMTIRMHGEPQAPNRAD